MTQLPNNHLFVKLPEGAKDVRVVYGTTGSTMASMVQMVYCRDGKSQLFKSLPPGSYSIVCMKGEETSAIAEQIAERVSGWSNPIYYDYTAGGRDYRDVVEAAFPTALESLQSLYRSLGIEKLNGVILKKL